MRPCGGCHGLGRHVRWCPEAVGRRAALLGSFAEEAEGMADRLGSNHMEATNLLYRAAGILKRDALAAVAAVDPPTSPETGLGAPPNAGVAHNPTPGVRLRQSGDGEQV